MGALIVMLTIVVTMTIYSFWYLYKEKLYLQAITNIWSMIIATFKSTLDLLTVLFLFVYYSELVIRQFYRHDFSVRQAFERNPENSTELIIFIIYIIVAIGSVVFWAFKVQKVATRFMTLFKFQSQIVSLTVGIYVFIIWIMVQIGILLPLYSYGIVGTFGGPSTL